MAQFKKVVCAYHPELYITNFCKQKTCLMPLCPSCIGTHNQYHDKNGFRATYNNIVDVLSETQNNIYNLISSLDQDKKRNDLTIANIYNLPTIVHQKVLLAKNHAYNAVDSAFEELEKQVLSILQRKHEQTGIYSLQSIEKQQKRITQALIQLDQMQYMLKGENCLASVIKFLAESQLQFNVLHNQLAPSLYNNQVYQPTIQFNPNAANNIKAIVSRFLQIQFNIPTTKLEKSQFQTVPGFGGNKTSSVIRKVTPTKNVTPNKNLTPSRVRNIPPLVLNQQAQSPHYSRIQPNTLEKSEVSPNLNIKQSNYDQEFESLTKKVKEMRKQNQILTKALKKI